MRTRSKHLLGQAGLSLRVSLMIFIIFLSAAFLSGVLMHVVIEMGILPNDMIKDSRFLPIFTLVACTIIGTVLSIGASHSTLKIMEKFIEATNKLAHGDFSARINVKCRGELKAMVDNFNHMAKELGSIEVLRTDFINNFSHEFKTPIVSIKGFAEILKYDDLSTEERKEYLDIVIEESARLATLATNVLELSKIEQQGILTNKQSFNLGEQIRQCVLVLEAKINYKRLHLELNIQDDYIIGNREMMSQVWLNLLDNAIKFTNEQGWLYLYMKKSNEYIEIELKDTGCGISKTALTKIFDKFYQADCSHATHGNGLGLAMVKKIIELHHGTIECQSELGKGTTFKILLPIK